MIKRYHSLAAQDLHCGLGESIGRELKILVGWFKGKEKDEIMRRIRKSEFQGTNL